MKPATEVGRWLGGTGPESDCVVSTRVRLARNLTDVPFVARAEQRQQERVIEATRWALENSGAEGEGSFVDDEMLTPERCNYLVERHLASPDFCASPARRGLWVSTDESFSLMVNEEDHLRFGALASGLDFPAAFGAAARMDERLETELQYAFSPAFGFLTACVSNVGTAMRASVLVHLPALVLTRDIERVLRGAMSVGLVVRGLHGEGSETRGNFFQISNQKTVGVTEAEVIETVTSAAREMIGHERAAREYLMHNTRVEVEDKIFRSLALLRGARILTSHEAVNLLATVRVGIALGIINELNYAQVARLLVLIRPANLQAVLGETLGAHERDERRATFVREELCH
jgi:protein arginine kinase